MTAHTIKIGIPGAAGRMGRMLIREIDAAPDLELVAASDRAGTDAIGQDSGLLAGTGCNDIIIGDDPATLAAADVIIDFTSPAASVAHAAIAADAGRALVVGTTGLTAADEDLMEQEELEEELEEELSATQADLRAAEDAELERGSKKPKATRSKGKKAKSRR